MVIVSFSSDILNDAQFLGQIGSFEALTEVCSLAVSNIKAGKVSDLKGYAKAAQALNLPVDSLANGVLALSQIYIECAKKNVSVTDFNLSIEDIQISADQRKVLVDTYDAHVKVIREQLAAVSMRLPHYADLDWRLDVEISSRCLRKKIEPTYLLELFTVDALEST